MPFAVTDRGDFSVLTIKGKFLGSIERADFNAAVDDLKGGGKKNLVIDLSKADFMDSTAIGLVMRSLTTMRGVGGNVHLAGLNTRIKNLFLLTRLLGPVVEDYETVDEAASAFATAEA